MKKIIKFIEGLVYPAKCAYCNRITDIGKDIKVCEDCQRKVALCENSLCCRICGKPQVSVGDKGMCYSCLTRTYRTYKKAAAVVKYDHLTASGVKRYKDGRHKQVGKFFASQMANRLKSEFENVKFDYIVGVPPDKKRTMKRGSDPIEYICRHLSYLTDIPYLKGALRRIKDVPKQSTLKYEERLTNLIGAIGLGKGINVEKKTLLLIDDVMTTGSTVNECGYILKEGGAKAVYVLTFATVIKEPKTYKNAKEKAEKL